MASTRSATPARGSSGRSRQADAEVRGARRQGTLKGDPNIKQSAGDNSVPNKTPACEVRVPGALRICDFTSKPLVITFIVPARDCEAYLGRVDALRSRFPGVNFVAVVSGPRDRARALVRRTGGR